ncbi:MAG: cytochrome-c peroxidase [Steroidobacterales bacterium]
MRVGLPASLLLICVAGCSASSGGDGNPASPANLTPAAQLGELIFHDVSLSASGKMSCATCHDPDNAFAAPPGGGSVPLGGPGVNVPGFRNAPSLRYLTENPSFFFNDEGTPTGGFDRDGRADSLAIQARRPFLSAHEMANAAVEDVVAKLSDAAYADDFRTLFGQDIFSTPDTAFDRMMFALQKYQHEDIGEFAPYSSKYDAFLAGCTGLSAQELRGLALYNDPARGNCAACHPSGRGPNGEPPLFTDFTYDNLGVPRNAAIPANADPAYFDLGICGPDRTDIVAGHPELCGAFKVPTLRNIALTAPYFHNGRIATLREVLQFYVRRDTNPDEFYPLDAGGQPVKFDDLPDAYKTNVNAREGPYNRHPGDVPALGDSDIEDVVAFLDTLTDGFQP